ncbi:MAG: ATP-binding protein [Bacillota bacterium]|nr:ATP-binding protein [Bacillota bacterium]
MLIKSPGKLLIKLIKTLVVFALAAGSSFLVSLLGIGNESIIMVFLLGVLFTTVLTSSSAYGIIASIMSLMLFNFLYTDPRYTFIVYSSQDIILLLFFLVTAVVSGFVTSRLQQQKELVAQNELTTQTLYHIASGFLSVNGKRNIIMQGIAYIHEFVANDCVVQLDDSDQLYMNLSAEPNRSCRQYPILSAQGHLGVMRIYAGTTEPTSQTELIIQAVVTQLGIALDREKLYSEQGNIRLAMEQERLRATLLRSIAHDLRSPLTALSGAGNLLADDYDNLSDEMRKKLAADISEEIAWLISLVENILNMTRINESQLILHKDDEVIDDVVSEAIVHVDRLLKDRKFSVTLPDEVVTVQMDGRLIVQVLINLLENAIRHTPPDSDVSLTVTTHKDKIAVAVADTGEGIDESIAASLFDRFVTISKAVSDGRRGMGLGLAICKAIIEAHGGTIAAEVNKPKGTRIIFTLPVGENSWKEN